MRAMLLSVLGCAAAACTPIPPYGPGYGPPGPGVPPPSYGPPQQDQCGAGELAWLVGRSRAEIPPPRPGQARRVYATGDALTMDYSPMRLNIEHDPRTARVVRVYCG